MSFYAVAVEYYFVIELAYLATALGMLLWSTGSGNWGMVRIAAVLLGGWLVNQLFTQTTGLVNQWWFNALIDSCSAAIMLKRPMTRVHRGVMEFFILSLLIDCTFGISGILGKIDAGNPTVNTQYAIWLTVVGLFQLIYFVVNGSSTNGGKRNRNYDRAGLRSGSGMVVSPREGTQPR